MGEVNITNGSALHKLERIRFFVAQAPSPVRIFGTTLLNRRGSPSSDKPPVSRLSSRIRSVSAGCKKGRMIEHAQPRAAVPLRIDALLSGRFLVDPRSV